MARCRRDVAVADSAGGRTWTWDETTGQWYLYLFLSEQPELAEIDWSAYTTILLPTRWATRSV